MTTRKQQIILVTGGAGYLGCVLLPALLERGKVYVVDNLYFGKQPLKNFINHENFNLICEDAFNISAYEDILSEADAVIHLAGLSNDPSADLDPSLTIRSNFLATNALGRKAKELGVKRFINISSCSVYGSRSENILYESSHPEPVTLYALCKLMCEKELSKLASLNFCVTSLRFATLFGYSPRMRFDLVVNTMTKTALSGQDINIHGNGEQYRPFLHVADAAESIMHMLDIEKEKISGDVFNVGNNKFNYMIKDLAHIIVGNFPGLGVEIIAKNIDVRSYNVDFSKLKNQTGFEPNKDVLFGVKELILHNDKGEFETIDDPKYYNILVAKQFNERMVIPQSPASLPEKLASIDDKCSTNFEKRPKVVGMILAHNVGSMLCEAYNKIPKGILDEIYVMDNSTHDETYKIAKEMGLKIFRNTVRDGYGGNVKEGLLRGMEMGADYIVEIHGDGAQFHPKSIKYAFPYMEEGVDFILGSRFQNPRQALRNGMPLIRYMANRFLSFFDRAVLKLPFTEFHTGFRIYGKKFLKKVPFEKNSDDYLFSFQIIAQAAYCNATTAEVPVEADYHGEHTSHRLSGAFLYAFQTFKVLYEYILAKQFSTDRSIFTTKDISRFE